MTHLSPEAIAWVRERIGKHNDAIRTASSKSIDLANTDARRPLIDLLVTFTGADREALRKLTSHAKGIPCETPARPTR